MIGQHAEASPLQEETEVSDTPVHGQKFAIEGAEAYFRTLELAGEKTQRRGHSVHRLLEDTSDVRV